jgi:Uma2 family endonuclease
MERPPMETGVKAKLDYSDYLVAPDDGKRYEILDGDLCVTPAPSPRHQNISWLLECELDRYFGARGIGKMFHAPIDVILGKHDVVQPDIVVVADPGRVSGRGIEGAPLLAVEILSPSTGSRDRGLKAQRYARLGVLHYWLVDPEARSIEALRAVDGQFRRAAYAEGEATLHHPDWEGLAIDLAPLWL